MVVTQLWATQQKRLQSQQGGRIWFGPKSTFWLRQFREKIPKVFCKPLIFLKMCTMKFGLIGFGPSWSNAKNFIIVLNCISYLCTWIFACLSNGWNDMLCVLRLQDQHYTDNQLLGRRTSIPTFSPKNLRDENVVIYFGLYGKPQLSKGDNST